MNISPVVFIVIGIAGLLVTLSGIVFAAGKIDGTIRSTFKSIKDDIRNIKDNDFKHLNNKIDKRFDGVDEKIDKLDNETKKQGERIASCETAIRIRNE